MGAIKMKKTDDGDADGDGVKIKTIFNEVNIKIVKNVQFQSLNTNVVAKVARCPTVIPGIPK